MFVIMSYDIEQKRGAKALKIAQKYLQPVQRSLFHGFLTHRQLQKLKKEMAALIIPEADSVVFYESSDGDTLQIDGLGIISDTEMIL